MSYYGEQLEKAEAWEQYIVERLQAEGRVVERHKTRAAQYAHGDTTIGLELKFDLELTRTGNLYIEVAEKSRPEQAEWIDSGIYARADFKWYGVGDYRDFYIFRRSALKRLAPQMPTFTIARGTSRGFLLEPPQREELVEWQRHWSDRAAHGGPGTQAVLDLMDGVPMNWR